MKGSHFEVNCKGSFEHKLYMSKRVIISSLSLFLCLFSASVFAHVDQSQGGFYAGLLHPVLGVDHLLAMISVGVLSAQMGGSSIWRVPATFVVVMILGAITGIMGIPLISVEFGIAVSVFVLGIAIASERKMPQSITLIFVAFFAVFHGHAHGMEIPDIAQPYLYILGFVSGTAAIHIAGVIIGLLAGKTNQSELFLRHVGSAIAGIGFYLMLISW